MCRFNHLDEPMAVADVLENLKEPKEALMAYQIAFDLYESATQQFLSRACCHHY